MTTFESMHETKLVGKLVAFDRMIFKGHLTRFFPLLAFATFLGRQGILLKFFGRYVQQATEKLKARAQAIAADSGRPCIYLQSASTKRSGRSKEDRAREIAARDHISEGLICVFSSLEPCMAFDVRGNRDTHKLECVRRRRVCLHFYFYFLDPRFGFMHVRIQSWFPFTLQVYISGREHLARQLDKAGISYRRYDNALTHISDLEKAQLIARRLVFTNWERLLDAFARRVNPCLPLITKLGFGPYHWVLDQCEIATDMMFRDRETLAELLPALHRHALTAFSADDVMHFLGRRPHWALKGEVTTSLTRRPEGRRVKHQLKRNSIKFYDKWNILRVETTINNAREFDCLRIEHRGRRTIEHRVPMGKSVANVWRHARAGEEANERYLEALANATPTQRAIVELDTLCHPRTKSSRRVPRFNPVSAEDSALFAAVLAGEHTIHGFRNKDIATRLHPSPPDDDAEAKRRCAQVSRKLRKLSDHGLTRRRKGSRRYQVTPRGQRLMGAAIAIRTQYFPEAAAG